MKKLLHNLLMTGLFCVYMMLILIFVIIETIRIPLYIGKDWEFIGWSKVLTPNNIVAFISILIIIGGVVTLLILRYKFGNSPKEFPLTCKNIQSLDYDYIPSIVTLLAVATFSYDSCRGLLLFMVLLVVLYLIFINTNTFFNSPLFKILGLNTYEIEFDKESQRSIVLSFQKLQEYEL